MPGWMKKMVIGVKRNWKMFFTSGFAAYGVCWAIIDGLTKTNTINEDLIRGPERLLLMVLVSVIVALIQSFPRSKISFELGLTGTCIEVEFGDLFLEQEIKIIPVNDAFDSVLGPIVAPNSLHGLFITKKCAGIAAVFDGLIAGPLKNVPSTPFKRSGGGKGQRYPVGTTVPISVGVAPVVDVFCLVASTRTDAATSSPIITLPEHILAMERLWEEVRIVAGGMTVCAPLFGNGLAAISLPPQELLHLLLITFLASSSPVKVVPKLRVILHSSVFEQVDLAELRRRFVKDKSL